MANILGSDLSKGIGQLLAERRLCVPSYQRSYAWKRQQVDELFQDLRRAIEDEKPYYFLGSIVGYERADGLIEIVDGQQRLATTTILLAAIRDRLAVMREADVVTRFEEAHLYKTEGIANPTRYPRLKLNEYDNDYFQKRILSQHDSPQRSEPQVHTSHHLIDSAAKYAESFVKTEMAGSRDAAGQKGQFDLWVRYIVEKARVIFIQVPDASDAYTIFETLNDRGLELTIADLAKNYLFGMAKDRVHEVMQSWTRMTGVLQSSTESEGTKAYIHHLWSSYNGVTRERELFKAIRDKITNVQSAVDFGVKLASKAELYTAARNSAANYWIPYGPRTKRHIDVLNHLKVKQVRMLLLAVMDNFPQAEIDNFLETVSKPVLARHELL